MQPRSLGFSTDLALRVRSGAEVEDRGDHLVVRSPDNPEYWWGNFILVDHLPAPAECESWVEVFSAAFPGALHVAIGFDVTEGDKADLAWFATRGFELDASAVMTAGALRPPPRFNREADCRLLGSDDDWAQSVELCIRTNDRRVHDESFRRFVARRVEGQRRMVAGGEAGWFGAFLGGRLVCQMGLVAAGEGLARYQQVETEADHRRQGLAGTLAHYAGSWGLTKLGARTLVIVADPEYVAIDLYRKLGFEVGEAQLGVARPPEPATTL